MHNLMYRNRRNAPDNWHYCNIDSGFYPRDEDFEHLQFKIKDKVFDKPSKEFYNTYNKEFLWLKLECPWL